MQKWIWSIRYIGLTLQVSKEFPFGLLHCRSSKPFHQECNMIWSNIYYNYYGLVPSSLGETIHSIANCDWITFVIAIWEDFSANWVKHLLWLIGDVDEIVNISLIKGWIPPGSDWEGHFLLTEDKASDVSTLVSLVILIESTESKKFKSFSSLELNLSDWAGQIKCSILGRVSNGPRMVVIRDSKGYSLSIESANWSSYSDNSEEGNDTGVPGLSSETESFVGDIVDLFIYWNIDTVNEITLFLWRNWTPEMKIAT